MNEFYKIASPTTLASLIADLNDSELTPAQWRMLEECRRRLIANVGEVEAGQLVAGIKQDADLAYGRK